MSTAFKRNQTLSRGDLDIVLDPNNAVFFDEGAYQDIVEEDSSFWISFGLFFFAYSTLMHTTDRKVIYYETNRRATSIREG